jgi:branched-chain amino acid transport system permease protein
MFTQILINGLITGLLYSLAALGFSLIYGGTRVFHLAHGAVYTGAAYLYLAWLLLWGRTFAELGWQSYLAGGVLTLVSVSVLAAILERAVYFPLFARKSPPLVGFISSLGLYIIIVNLIALLFGNEIRTLNPGVQPAAHIGGITISRMQMVQFVIPIFVLSLVFIILRKTTLGRNIRALSDNPTLASVFGLDPKKIRLMIVIMGSVLAAVASLLQALEVGVDPQMGLSVVLTAAVAAIIGGANSYLGTLLAALFLGVAQNSAVWFISARWQDAITFIVLMFILLARHEGVFAARLRMEER